MFLDSIILLILTSVGITNIVVDSTLFEGVRNFIHGRSEFFGKMINCSMCSGFWVGLLLSLWLEIPILFAFVASLCSHFYSVVVSYIDTSTALKWSQLNIVEEIDEKQIDNSR